ELFVGVGFAAGTDGPTSLAGVEEPFAVARDARAVVAGFGVNDRAEIFGFAPHAALVVRNVEVGAADGIGTAKAADEQETLIRSDEGFKAVDARTVEIGAEVFGFLILAIDQTRSKDVVMAGLAAGSKVEIAVGSDRSESLLEAVVHRSGHELWFAPALGSFGAGPDVKMMLVLPIHRTIRCEEKRLAVGRKNRIGVAIQPGKWENGGLGPLA